MPAMMPCLPPPSHYPIIETTDGFDDWLKSATPRQWCAYRVWRGQMPYWNEIKAFSPRMARAMSAHEGGLVVLAQRRVDERTIHYLAKRI